jgi:hypothetical protein
MKQLENLPGITATDSMGYRIEALRVHLENMLGDMPFIAAYRHLTVSQTQSPSPQTLSNSHCSLLEPY